MADMEVLAPGGHQHLVGKIKEQLAMKADASLASAVEKVIENQPTAVLSGTVLSASDAYAEPPVSLTVDGKSTQDGTPTPDAPVEIVSVEQPELTFAGKNLLPTLEEATTVNGVTFTPNSDGSVTIVGTATAATTVLLNDASHGGRIDNTGNTIGVDGLTLSGAPNGSSDTYCLRVNYYTFKTGGGSNHTGYVTSGTTLVRNNSSWHWVYIYLFVANGATVNATVYPQLEQGRTATAYEPYQGNTVTLYDGTLRSLPDGTKDTLALSYLRPSTREGWAWYGREVTRAIDMIDLGTMAWNQYTFSEHLVFRTNKLTTSRSGFCTALAISTTNPPASLSDNSICLYTTGWGSSGHMMARADAYDSASAFKAAMDGVMAQYKLATPTTTTLDPIELPILPAPNVTVWSDPSTGLKMRYVRDMQIVIDSLNSEIERAYAAIAPVESTTAKSNHAVGDYLMLGGTLCKVTSAIASGETIAIGTNVATTTVDAELASLE